MCTVSFGFASGLLQFIIYVKYKCWFRQWLPSSYRMRKAHLASRQHRGTEKTQTGAGPTQRGHSGDAAGTQALGALVRLSEGVFLHLLEPSS